MSIPKLRFKEFDGEYKLQTIKSIAKIFVGRDLIEDAFSPVKTETHIYPIYSNSVDNQGLYGYYNFEEFNFSDDALTVVGRGAGLGTAFYRQKGFGTIGRLLCLTPENKKFHPKYLADYINDKLVIHNESGGIPQLPRSSLEGYEVTLPNYEEQTKIASFLSSVDEKISQLTQKQQLLSQYKQGMMQKLFSQQIRFKADDGSEFGEWEDKILGDVIKFYNGKGHENNVDPNGDFVLINSKFVSSDTATFKKVDICNQKVFDDCLVMVMSDVPNGKALAKVLHITYGVKYALNQRIGMFVFNKKNHSKFFQYQLNRHKYYLAFDSGVGQTNLKKEEVLSCPILVPCIEEQTKIANFLSAIDQKIEIVAQQIEQAKLWKKGLLQQMFV